MSPLPRVPRSGSQHQIPAHADTFIYSARAASHLEATVSRRPVTAHAVAKPAQAPFYPRRPPDPQAFESLACSALRSDLGPSRVVLAIAGRFDSRLRVRA
ncbi:hypothetical protein NDU88_002628 [Pleurodeles waltl]|uniref:Uncharacterized protein n=1 Tax=Pleurodeles waltl TaxID=8319 RepID=A0AAV7UBE4_PLEWA|nr:hypothetical protein NDU88_002628 [Pleurodeles waltl]